MKILKKLVLVMLIVCIVFPVIASNFSHAAPKYSSKEIGDAIVAVATKIVDEGNDDIRGQILRYSQHHRVISGYSWKLVSDNQKATTSGGKTGDVITGKLAFDCSSFAAYVYKHATSEAILFTDSTKSFFTSDSKYTKKYFEIHDASEAEPGDILWKDGHMAIYIGNGETAEAKGLENKKENEQVARGKNSEYIYAYRLNEAGRALVTSLNTEVDWWSLGIAGTSNDNGFYYNGLAKRSQAATNPAVTAIKTFADYTDYAAGIATLALKVQVIGWASIFENVITSAVYIGTGDEKTDNQKLTVERIIYNKVPILDVNFFDLSSNITIPENVKVDTQEGGASIEEAASGVTTGVIDVVYIIRDNVSRMYVLFRYIAIACLLVVLIYIGIRMALATIGEQKARYKQMFINWLVSFIIVFFIHFFMLGIILINNFFVGRMANQAIDTEVETVTELRLVDKIDEKTGEVIIDSVTEKPVQELKEVTVEITKETSLYDTVLTKAYDFKASEGFAGTVLYVFLVYYLVKFLIIYFKRVLVVYILAVISPLIGMTYAIDKIKDNKSQSLSTWMKEFSANVLVQSIHGLLYLIFVKTAIDLAFGYSVVGIILAFVFMNFMLQAEKLLLSMLVAGGKNSSLKNALDATAGVYGMSMVALHGASSVGRTAVKAGSSIATKTTETIDKVADSGIGNKIANNKAYKGYSNTVNKAREKLGMENKTNRFHAHGNNAKDIKEYRKESNSLRKSKKDKRQSELNRLQTTIGGSKRLLVGIPKALAHPQAGFSDIVSGYSALRNLYGRTNGDIKVYRGQGIRYTAGMGTLDVLVGATTLGLVSASGLRTYGESGAQKAEAVDKHKEKLNKIAERRAKELKGQVKEKVERDAKAELQEMIRKGKKIRITENMLVDAKQTILEGLRYTEGSYFESIAKDISRTQGVEIDVKEFSKEAFDMMDKTMGTILFQEMSDIQNKFDSIHKNSTKEEILKPTEEQRDEILATANEKQVNGMLIRAMQRLDGKVDALSAERAIERYKKTNRIKTDLRLEDAELVLKGMAYEAGIKTKEVSPTLEKEKTSTYVSMAKQYITDKEKTDSSAVKVNRTTEQRVTKKAASISSTKAGKQVLQTLENIMQGNQVTRKEVNTMHKNKEYNELATTMIQAMPAQDIAQMLMKNMNDKIKASNENKNKNGKKA